MSNVDSAVSSPAEDGYRMPPETAVHERTLMAWPCRKELWGRHLEAAKYEYACVANGIAAFEPVTMVVADAAAAVEARARLTDGVEVMVLPLDDSWMRDNGPIFVLDEAGRRAGVHFRFNAWGEKFVGWERDEAAGGALAGVFGDRAYEAPLVLEGGSILIDSGGRLVTTEQCLLSPNRNGGLDKGSLEAALCDHLGAREIIWLGKGLYDDRDTDGHIDGFAVFNDAGELILQARPAKDPDHETMAENRERAVTAGLKVIDFLPMAHGAVDDVGVVLPYLNLYLCNGGAVVPIAGGDASEMDEEALATLRSLLPGREVIGVPGLTISFGGGGPHCITQQVPARRVHS